MPLGSGGSGSNSELVAHIVEPEVCSFHKLYGKQVPALYDGNTTEGIWAYMCQNCFETYGLGLGIGVGQKLIIDGISE